MSEKYTGSVTIIDDEGETVFEAELSDDEMIEFLLQADDEEEPPTPPKRSYTKRADTPMVKKAEGSRYKKPRTVTCKKCGETGHLQKTCTWAASPKEVSSAPEKVGERDIDKPPKMMTAEEFADIKEGYNDGMSIDMYRITYSHLDLVEMRKVAEFDEYKDYVTAYDVLYG